MRGPSGTHSAVYGITAKACDLRFWEREKDRGWATARNTGREPEDLLLFRDARRMAAACRALAEREGAKP